MANALTLLNSQTLGTSSVTFASISQAYRDLRVVTYNLITATNANMSLQFNGDTAANYSGVYYGFNYVPSVTTGTFTGTSIVDSRGYPTSSGGCMATIDIFDYSATDKHKLAFMRSQGNPTINGQGLDIITGRWANTAAITSVTFSLSTGSFAAGATFYLYGVSA